MKRKNNKSILLTTKQQTFVLHVKTKEGHVHGNTYFHKTAAQCLIGLKRQKALSISKIALLFTAIIVPSKSDSSLPDADHLDHCDFVDISSPCIHLNNRVIRGGNMPRPTYVAAAHSYCSISSQCIISKTITLSHKNHSKRWLLSVDTRLLAIRLK